MGARVKVVVRLKRPAYDRLHRYFLTFLACTLLTFLAGCHVLEVTLDKTPTADQNAISTLAALMVEGTQQALLATQIASLPTPLPPPGLVTGRICYPGDYIPSLVAYFKEVNSDQLQKLQLTANKTSYQVKLQPGEYVAYAWATSFQEGGMYTKAVLCGLTSECTDRSPQPFIVSAGRTTPGIDLCDWAIPIDQLPIPPGSELPGP